MVQRRGKIKIAFVSNCPMNLYLFRMPWMKALRREGFDIYAVVPEGKYSDCLEAEGIKVIHYYLQRESLNPFKELKSVWHLFRIFRRHGFDVVHSFTIKPNIYGTLAAGLAKVPHIIKHVTGLGYIYTVRNMTTRIFRPFVSIFHKVSCAVATKVIFQNNNDYAELGVFVDRSRRLVIKGTGVDSDYFIPGRADREKVERIRDAFRITGGMVVITMIARLYWAKGVREFIEAANILHQKYPHTLFLVVGWIDGGNPDAVDEEWMRKVNGSFVKFAGRREDIREILYSTDIYTLPSYREGLPRTVIEAMSMKRPVAVTDIPGSREVVEQGVNGFLVPARNSFILAQALEKLILDKDLRERMGKAGREKIIKEFSNEIIVSKVLDLYREFFRDSSNTSGTATEESNPAVPTRDRN